ncbi:MAG: apolipoprotein N-acyltransferase [Marinilabiliales bacterium]
MNIKHYQRYIFSIFTGVLLSFGWSQWHLGPVLLFAFIPLLFVERFFYENRKNYRSVQVFLYAYIAFFIWNLINTWWIYYASLFGAVAAVVLNSLFMAVVWWLFHGVHRILGHRMGYFSLIVFWIAFEYLHLNWELSWPWLTLGYGFSANILLVQWYDITGSLGGSFWILLTNVIAFQILYKNINGEKLAKMKFDTVLLIIIIFFPIVLSVVKYYTYNEKLDPYNFVVIQPNIDPYNEKYTLSEREQIQNILNLADSLADENTDFVVCPETAFPTGLWEEDIDTYENIKLVQDFLKKYPRIRFIIGASTYKMFDENEPVSATARKMKHSDDYYDAYNASMQLTSDGDIQIYHKSKLVLGVEKMPFPEFFGMFGDFALDLGGIVGSLGVQDTRDVFYANNDKAKVGVPVCYESVYGEFITEWVNNGAGFIFVITNDGWWEDTPGYRQHFRYSSLRAIETRRSIARSANTGISCLINQKGDVLAKTGWWTRTAIKGSLNYNETLTYYVKHGDYIGRISAFFAIIMLLYAIVQKILIKRKSKV